MSFSRKGYRQSMKSKIKLTKKHIKRFYQILHELDDVAKAIYKAYPSDEYNEDDIVEVAKEFTDLSIDKMEKNILLSKLTQLAEHNKELEDAAEGSV